MFLSNKDEIKKVRKGLDLEEFAKSFSTASAAPTEVVFYFKPSSLFFF
jgi:hypothetical protein